MAAARQVICDAHVHVGYYRRLNYKSPMYYSPRRVFGVLDRCGCKEFIVSSTCAQMEEIKIYDILKEAEEMKRIAGPRAHNFFWLSGHLYDEDKCLRWIESGLFEGVKFHELETPWVKERRCELEKILRVIERQGLRVQFHGGDCPGCTPVQLAEIARQFPTVKFDFAHCKPCEEMVNVITECKNVWTDTAYLPREGCLWLRGRDVLDRVMFGSDLPVWQAHESIGLTGRYKKCVEEFKTIGISGEGSFRSYLS